jgi:hypothetical protein
MNPPTPVRDLGHILDGFAEYLRLLAGLQLSAQFAGKIDLSGVVQQTLVEAYQARACFPMEAAHRRHHPLPRRRARHDPRHQRRTAHHRAPEH